MYDKEKKEILLESGTNELEIMEFKISDRHFGINVAKVVEIMKYVEITPMTNTNEYIEGVFKPRDEIITVIDLAAYMNLPPSQNNERDILIITYYNNVIIAFHAHSVEAIHRISWESIEKPSEIITGGEEGLATGIARVVNRLITIVDFEKILVDIMPNSGIQLNELESIDEREENSKPIILAEDSPVLSRMILSWLQKYGYKNIIRCSNGSEAWNKLNFFKNNDLSIEQQISCVITDIEMPLMDGYTLLKNIRNDNELKNIPVIIFSSLINDDMIERGHHLGATAQVSKPEIRKLINELDKYIS